jgi:hypothetical protein
MALRISRFSGGLVEIGINWVSRFLRKHSSISTKIGRNIDVLRLRNTSPEILREWYALFEQKFRTKAIRPEDI